MRERYALAVDNREFLLARYVARSLGEDELAEANRWLRAQGDPDSFLSRADIGRRDETYRTQLGYAASRLAIGNPLAAWRHWSRLRKDMDFTRELERSVARQVALWAARRDIGEADRLLQTLDPEAIDDEVRRWQIRNALRRQDWLAVLHLVDSLEPQERDREEWRYWKAIALDKTGQPAESMLTLSSLARERSYYGFLAADELGIDYAIETVRIEADESAIARLAGDPALVRARELFLTGLDGRGRSEWNEAVRGLSQHDKAQAALLAERWDWPSRAIASAAQAGQMDSLDLRYPLPHLDAFRESAAAAGIRESWAYGVARSESIFMRDVRSSAGAIGLMQLMPATGRSTAREIRLPYSGLNTLTDPASNIRLGATYLGKMHDRFNQHPAVATAAYNAGPNRVSQWLPDSAAIDARIWVETIPYNETRNYVRSVLTSDVIFAWRLTGKVPRLSDQLPEIRPPQLPQSASGQ
jgi:soluble lytic murein transglycosylase